MLYQPMHSKCRCEVICMSYFKDRSYLGKHLYNEQVFAQHGVVLIPSLNGTAWSITKQISSNILEDMHMSGEEIKKKSKP